MPKVHAMIPSKFLKQEDIQKPILVTIKTVEQFSVGKDDEATMKWGMTFHEIDKPLTLNVSNITTLESYLGDDTDNWIGKQTVVFVDPDVMYAGKKVGGIRVRPPKGQVPQKPEDLLPF